MGDSRLAVVLYNIFRKSGSEFAMKGTGTMAGPFLIGQGCPLLEVKQTRHCPMSAFDPKQTLAERSKEHCSDVRSTRI
jgi:hypothetical protein